MYFRIVAMKKRREIINLTQMPCTKLLFEDIKILWLEPRTLWFYN